MSLRFQVGLLLLTVAAAIVALTYGVQTHVVMPAFVEIEHQAAERDLHRFIDAVGREEELLAHSVLDWSAWDDLYEYVHTPNDRFKQATLNDESFSHAHVNVICILDENGQVVWGDVRDISTNEQIDAPDIVGLFSTPNTKFKPFDHETDKRSGLLQTSQGPLLFAMRPIVTSAGLGPIRGAIVFGRLMTRTELNGIADRTHIDMSFWNIDGEEWPLEFPKPTRQTVKHECKVVVRDNQILNAYTVLPDVFGAPLLLARANLPRDVTSQGRVSTYTATACCLVATVITLILLWNVVQWRVVQPLMEMAGHAQRVGTQDDLKSRLRMKRGDEIGQLADSFDAMVANLEQSRKTVLDSAHQAGMAEIASEVLHNVGNAVNSANCCIECLEQNLSNSKSPGLDRATKLLQEQSTRAAEFFTSDPRGQKLIEYLVQLNEHLQEERSRNTTEVLRMRDTVRHIRDVIASQQEFAKKSDFRQELDFAKLVEEVLQLNSHAIHGQEIQVNQDIPWLPELYLSKSKTTQILVNLVRNAIQAMQHQPSDQRKLTITAQLLDQVDLEFAVSDSGCGFTDEVKHKLFTHGFTTKETGNGFGLHYCANAVREIGGSITAFSRGPGLGASFRIRIPKVLETVHSIH